MDTDCDNVRKCASTLSSVYSDDLDKDFGEELIQFKTFVREEKKRSPATMLQLLHTHGLQSTFPNVFVGLRIFLTLPVTNAEGERSFSRLKRVKNELRTTMTQTRLTALSLLTIESELMKELDFEDVIDTFACAKSRKKQLC